ncbi:preprotein translocase subunit YajC [Boudabousia marimammalium]
MGKKQREREAAKRTEALAVGNWVMTRAGFYGKIAEIDGDVVVLETPLGDESLWDAGSVVVQKEPPVAEGSTLLDGSLEVDALDDFVETELYNDVEEEDTDA